MAVPEWILNLPHNWEDDPRDPILAFSWADKTFGLYLPDIIQNIEIVLVLVDTALVAAAFSVVIFHYILSPKHRGTPLAYLLGYGVIVPFWIYAPLYTVRLLNIRNAVFRFVFGTVPTLSLFRTLEAMHGFCPPHTTESMDSFALYYASPFIAQFDTKEDRYIQATTSTLINKLLLYIRGLCVTGAMHSLFLLYPDAFIEFGAPFDRERWYSWNNIFRWRQLWQNLCFAVFFQTYLATCAFGLQFVTMIATGLQLEEMWINPLSGSTSFSDFWGRRWNLSVHNTLKRGVFQPVRQHFPKYMALTATFLASGLFHEWLIWLVFSPLPRDDDEIFEEQPNCDDWKCYTPTYGPSILFFMFQGLLIATEFSLGSRYKSLLHNSVPGPIATLLVICLGGSVAHFFSEAYVNSSYFVGGRVAYILVKPLN